MRLLLILWLLVMASPSEAEPLGTYPNNAAGVTVLSDAAAGCKGGMRRAEARNANNAVVMAGCYGLHNGLSVVVLWERGPATTVPVHLVTWADKPPANMDAKPEVKS